MLSLLVFLDCLLQVAVNPNVPGSKSLSITYTSGTGVAGWSNRGIGNEGMFIQGGKNYDGYVLVLAPNGGARYHTHTCADG